MSKRIRTDVHKGRGGLTRLSGSSAEPKANTRELMLQAEMQKEIHQLVELLKQHNLTELELEHHGVRIRLRRETVSSAPAPTLVELARASQAVTLQSPVAPAMGETAGLATIRSPIVGTFYRAPSADADPYVEEGDFVKKGQVLCIVEAMKLMNEIESEVDGRIVSILAESTKPVEYGQPLFLIDPAPAT
ncbi:MAG: acetyl-CoA carboxylase biotin carboxyl carrier protein [Nitrospiraceae bacterium]